MSIRSIAAQFAAVTAGLMFAASAHANLVVNGGFENPDVATNNWAFFPSSGVPGWDGSNIEIWDTYGGVVAPEGTQHAELNSHPGNVASPFSIYQSFATAVGQTYDVSFFYRARVDANESFQFSVGPLAVLLSDHVTGSWSQYMSSFVANGSLTTITFTSTNAGTLGNFLDDVVVTRQASVPEPGTLALLGLGLVGLGLGRRRKAA